MYNPNLSEKHGPIYSIVYWVVVKVQAIFYIEGGNGAFFRILIYSNYLTDGLEQCNIVSDQKKKKKSLLIKTFMKKTMQS